MVLDARNRPGGRVEQTTLADGRIVQLGGEVIGPFHEAYVGLVEELGLTIVPSFPQLPGEDTWVLADGRYVGVDGRRRPRELRSALGRIRRHGGRRSHGSRRRCRQAGHL